MQITHTQKKKKEAQRHNALSCRGHEYQPQWCSLILRLVRALKITEHQKCITHKQVDKCFFFLLVGPHVLVQHYTGGRLIFVQCQKLFQLAERSKTGFLQEPSERSIWCSWNMFFWIRNCKYNRRITSKPMRHWARMSRVDQIRMCIKNPGVWYHSGPSS